MARTSARNVPASVLSDDPKDKLAAALNCWVGMLKRSTTYERAPMYFDACLEWFYKLSDDERDAVRAIADAAGSAHKDAALDMAALLPPAPRNPP